MKTHGREVAHGCAMIGRRRFGVQKVTNMCRWIVMLALTTMSASAGLNRLDALSMIESGNNDLAIGQAGEVSRFQIRPQVWRHYSHSRAYENADVAASVAQKHIGYLQTLFRERTGREATDLDLYILWNAGAGYYERHGFSVERVHREIRERAQRYVNLRTVPAAQLALYVSRS